MFDTICSLPLRAEIFTQALHPSLPILSVGLSSGHVHTFRLPSLDGDIEDDAGGAIDSSSSGSRGGGTTANAQLRRDLSASLNFTSTTTATAKIATPSNAKAKAKEKEKEKAKVIRTLPASVLSSSKYTSRRSSETGLDTVDTLWRTRRHKGSCRALSFNSDGRILFSAGSDGLVKAADSQTGIVVSKIAVPLSSSSSLSSSTSKLSSAKMMTSTSLGSELDPATVLVSLSPQNVVLGTDNGAVHIYDLRERTTLGARPAQSMRPHRTDHDPLFAEAITSLSPLPPTSESTSGTSRSWVSTAGSTVSCVDLRKGVVGVSEDQGDMLLSSTCVRGASRGGRRGGGDKVLVGGALGVVTVWERGQWADQVGRVLVQKDEGSVQSESTVDVMCTLPSTVKIRGRESGGEVVAAGLGNGTIKFLKLRGRGGEVIDTAGHDEMNFEGLTTLGFDVEGRMISGGGSIVKIWKERSASEAADDDDKDEEDVDEVDGTMTVQMGDGYDDDDGEGTDSSEMEERTQQRKKKRQKLNGSIGRFGDHGVMAIPGLD